MSTARRAGWLAVAGLLLATLGAQAGEWRYRVRKGENLWTITSSHLNNPKWLQPLQRLNQIIDPLNLRPGSEIRVPLAWTRRTAVQANIEASSGKVEVLRKQGSPTPVTARTLLSTGDVLRTGLDGHASIRYPDGSVTRLFPDTEIELQELEMLGESAQLTARIDLRHGRSESVVRPGSVVRRSDVQVSTPFSTTSVRGTHFRVAVLPEQQTALTGVVHGNVAVNVPHGRQTSVATGQGAVAMAGAASAVRKPLLPAPSLAHVESLQQVLPLRVEAGAVSGAAGYRGELATDAQFDHVVASAVSDSTGLVYPDVPDGHYFLRLRAMDGDKLEGMDAVREITLDARPEPPFLMQPSAGGTVTAGIGAFAWANRADAQAWEIEVYNADADGNPAGPAVHAISSAEPKTQLALAATDAPRSYAWRARVKTRDGQQGPFGQYAAFTVVPPGPQMGEQQIDGSRIHLGWGKQAYARQWRFELARDADFKDIVNTQTVSEPKVSFERPRGGRYYVRIAWIDAQGKQGPWGETQQFDIPRKPPYWLLVPAALLLL